jgi:hypothetical protein
MRKTDVGQSPSKRLVLPRCPRCGTETSLHAQVCPSCGSNMRAKGEASDTRHYGKSRWEPAPQVRRQRLLRPQLIATILITIMAFSGGLAVGPYVTSYRPMQEFVTVTVTTTNQELATVTVATTLGTSTSSSTTHYTTSRVTSQTPTTVTGKWLGSSANVVSYLILRGAPSVDHQAALSS